jgi:GNAT superfamily N-acetyltransferase
MEIRPATSDQELVAFLRVVETVHPGSGATVALLRHQLDNRPLTAFLLAVLDGEAVGAGTAMASSLPGALYAMARVRPEARRRGVGSALVRALADRARDAGLATLVGRVLEDDEPSRAFLARRGCVDVTVERPVRLDLASLPDDRPVAPEGVEIVSLADRPELVEQAYRVEEEAARDVPVGADRPEPRPFATWRSDTLEGPDALPDLCLVALADGAAVGWSGLCATGEEGVAENMLTGVLRAWRGRGVATALKREQAWRARVAGLEAIETTNDDENAPMRAVNDRLGFAPLPAWVLVRGRVADLASG